MIAFMASIICFVLLYSTVLNSIFTNKPVVASPDDPDGESVDVVKEQPVKNEILFLMMGVDAESVKKSKGTRTDTMMLTKINFDTGETSIMSLPRDTRVPIKGKTNKLNAAHAFGGPDLTIQTVRDFLGIDLDYYVKIDYNIVKDVVKAIGGVTIDVPINMTYDDPYSKPPLKIRLKKGVQELDGQKAHDFLRFRQNNDGSGYRDGDIDRIKAQQYFMKELVKQTIKPKNLLKIGKLLETYYDNVETNIPLKVMAKGALSANKIDTENMITTTIPGEGKYVGVVSYYISDPAATEEVVNEMFKDYISK